MNPQALSSFIWSVADLLRGDYKQSEYGRVILPFTVLRRLDCVLEATKPAVLKEFDAKTRAGITPDAFLLRKAGQSFYNTSPLDLTRLLGDQDHIQPNLYAYVQAFSPEARDIFERFDFHTQVERLAKANLLYLVTEKFAGIDLHPEAVDNASMGLVFEELIRKFAEISNETAGEHFTPREVTDYISETAVKINELGLANSSARMLPTGAVVFTRDATIGLAAITTRPMAVSQHLIAWCPSERITSLFLLRVFNAMKPHLESHTFGATIKTIGMADVKKLVTTVPPLGEQQAISEYIESELSELDVLTANTGRAISLLKERRSAFIAAAVTGQIDVRDTVTA